MKIEKTEPVPKRAKERASNKTSGGPEKTPKKLGNGRGTDNEGKTRKRRSASAGHDIRDKKQAKDPTFELLKHQRSRANKLSTDPAPERHSTRYGGRSSGPNYVEVDTDGEGNSAGEENANAPAANEAPAIEAPPSMDANAGNNANGNGLQMPPRSLFNREQAGPSGLQQNQPAQAAADMPPLLPVDAGPAPPAIVNAPAGAQAEQAIEYPGNWADWANERLPDNPPIFGLDAYNVNEAKGRRRQLRWSRSAFRDDHDEIDQLRGTLLVSLNRYHNKALDVMQRDRQIVVLNEAITTRDQMLHEHYRQRRALQDECQTLRDDIAAQHGDIQELGKIVARTRRRGMMATIALESFIEKNPGTDTSSLAKAVVTLKEKNKPTVKQGNKDASQNRILINIIQNQLNRQPEANDWAT